MPLFDNFRRSIFINDEEHAFFQLHRFFVDFIFCMPMRGCLWLRRLFSKHTTRPSNNGTRKWLSGYIIIRIQVIHKTIQWWKLPQAIWAFNKRLVILFQHGSRLISLLLGSKNNHVTRRACNFSQHIFLLGGMLTAWCTPGGVSAQILWGAKRSSAHRHIRVVGQISSG